MSWQNDPIVGDVADAMSPGAMAAEGMPMWEQAAVGAGKTMTGAYEGVRQMLPEGYGGYTPEQEAEIVGEHERYQQGLGDSLAATVGEALPYLAVPGMGQTRLGGMALDAAVGAGLEGSQFVDPGESRGERMAMGGAFGGLGRGVADEVASRIGGRWGQVQARDQMRGKAESVAQQAEEYGVPLSYGDMLGGQNAPNLRRMEAMSESVPFGMSKFRQEQNLALQNALGAAADPYPLPAREVGDLMQESLIGTKEAVRKGVGEKYDVVGDLMAGQKGTLGEAAEEAAGITGKSRAMGQYGADVGSDVKKYLERVDEATGEVLPLTDLDFGQMRSLRSDLGDDIRKFEAAGDLKSAKPLRQLKAGVERDMEGLAESTSSVAMEAEKAAGKAHAKYKETYSPKAGKPATKAIVRAIETDDPDEIFKLLITKKGATRVKTALKAMDSKGRDAVKSKIMNQAKDEATNADGVFSPAKVVKSLESNIEGIRNAFPKAEAESIEGMIEIMKVAKRAGQYAENPPTGMRTLIPTIAGAAGGLQEVIGLMTGAKAFTWFTTTPAGRKWLQRAGRTKDIAANASFDWPGLHKALSSKFAKGGARQAGIESGKQITDEENN